MYFKKHSIKNIGIYFDKISKIYNKRIALQFDEKEKYSYSYLNELSNNFIEFFEKQNIKENDLIAIESKKNVYVYAMIIAALKKGITYSFFDCSESQKRSELILRTLNPKKIFLFDKKNFFRKSVVLSTQLLNRILKQKNLKKINLKNKSYIAYIMFTSGSTGTPKGVQISHHNLSFFINWTRKTFKIKKETVMTNLNPLHFDNSVFDIYGSLFNGARLVPINKSEILNCKNLLNKLIRLKCNLWFSVPSLLNLILKLEKPIIFKNNFFKYIIFGGERFPVESVRRIHKYLKHSKVYNVSGPTECTCICSAHLVSKKELFNSKDIFVGKIINYFNYKIVRDNINSRSGELYLEGPAVSCGYINDHVRSNEKFYRIKNFYGYKTGDLVTENKNKNLKINGRQDNQIKFLGHRIEIEEIEKSINYVFKLSESLVIFCNKKTFPYKKLVLITDKKKLKTDILYSKLTKYLPRYMIPEEIKLIKNFKFNQNGKVDRKFYAQNI